MKKTDPKKPRPFVIGLTGSIGMGKSTIAAFLKEEGLPLFEADSYVHSLLRKGGKAVKPVGKLFPQALNKNAITIQTVREIVFGKPAKLRALEKIIHPMVAEAEEEFIARHAKRGTPAVILEIPLLFETKAEKRCDLVLCATCSKANQTKRVMARKGMTKARFKNTLARQMPDKEKRKKADIVINTDKSLADTKKQAKLFYNLLKKELPFA